MKHLKLFENFGKNKILIIVDVQKSFSKFFTKKYLSELNKYCNNFSEVYQIFDNHHEGKNPDLDYLYDKKPDIENKSDLYTFPNQVGLIEKRYNYDVNADFYKKILSEEVYKEMKSKDDNKQLKRGDFFKTTEGTIIVYIGNNHRYFHVPKKLYGIFMKFKEAQSEGLEEITIVGGSDGECIFDVIVSAKSLGLNISKNDGFIYSASSCPIS